MNQEKADGKPQPEDLAERSSTVKNIKEKPARSQRGTRVKSGTAGPTKTQERSQADSRDISSFLKTQHARPEAAT